MDQKASDVRALVEALALYSGRIFMDHHAHLYVSVTTPDVRWFEVTVPIAQRFEDIMEPWLKSHCGNWLIAGFTRDHISIAFAEVNDAIHFKLRFFD